MLLDWLPLVVIVIIFFAVWWRRPRVRDPRKQAWRDEEARMLSEGGSSARFSHDSSSRHAPSMFAAGASGGAGGGAAWEDSGENSGDGDSGGDSGDGGGD